MPNSHEFAPFGRIRTRTRRTLRAIWPNEPRRTNRRQWCPHAPLMSSNSTPLSPRGRSCAWAWACCPSSLEGSEQWSFRSPGRFSITFLCFRSQCRCLITALQSGPSFVALVVSLTGGSPSFVHSSCSQKAASAAHAATGGLVCAGSSCSLSQERAVAREGCRKRGLNSLKQSIVCRY